ncbi:MAG: hypothetical protein ABFC90_03675 [Bacteroidales bacterium]|nr:hypothetical protein [Bacteroidales bacterium]
MKKNLFFTLLLVSVCLFSCEDKVGKPDVWPEWPSRPLIENAQLRGLNNETSVMAGDKVRFTAHISDDYNDLMSYQLEFKAGGVVVASKTGTINGSSADIDVEAIFPFGAYYEDGSYYPEVVIKATNVLNFTTEMRLVNKENVSVNRPETPERLYIVDNNSVVYTLDRIENTYGFLSVGNLSGFGTSFKIASKLTDNNLIDYSGLVWGTVDGQITTVSDASAASIPSAKGNYPLKKLFFDMYSFNLSKTLNVIIEINKSEMMPTTKGGISYLVKEPLVLVQDCEVKFTGFDKNLTSMLRPDLFTDIDGNVAKFTGTTRNWRAFYNTVSGFMYVQTYNNEDNLLWYAGLGGGFPLPPYVATSDWFATEPHGYFSFKQTGTNVYELLIYLNTNMAFQVYRKIAWGTVVAPLTSLTPSLLKVEANNDAIPGPGFTPGVYNLKVDVEAKTIELIPDK